MAYTFDYLDARDPANPANRAANASVTIHAVGDATKTPLTITTTDGTPLPNPITVGADGYGPAFMHATLDRVAWSGGGYTNFMTAYEGIKNEAVAARTAADTAKAEAANSATSAANSAALVNAPADTAMQTLVNSTTSATRTALDGLYTAKGSLVLNVKDFGAKGDGTTDDRAAINTALDQIAAITASTLSTSRYHQRPTLFFPAGVYRITAGLRNINFRALRVMGAGHLNTAIHYDSALDEVVFDIGTFSAAPADIFGGVQDAHFEGIRIQRNGSTAGARVGQGIRISGGGGLVLDDVAVTGFKYGVNSPYGGDFNTYSDVTVEYCDVGIYQGPGGQQFSMNNTHIFGCVDGVVLDRFGHAHFVKPVFNSCATAGLVIEAITDTTTRQLTSFSAAGTSYQSKLVLDTPWFEGNAGGLGDAFTPTNYIENRNGGTDAYRDIEILSPFIVAGNTGTKTTTAFFANVSGIGAQRVAVRRPVFQGTMTRWFTGGGGYILDNPRITNGYTAPAYNDTAALYRVFDGTGRVTGLFPWADTTSTADGAHGTALEHAANGVLRLGFLNAGSYLYRAGFDIQNRRLFLDDPSASTAFSVSRSAAMPTTGAYGIGSFVHNTAPTVTAGKVLLGWVRLTTGSTHVDGTDWTPVYATTT